MSTSLLLALSYEQPTSGERLAKEYGCTRAAIAKRINALRDAGVLIDAIAREGYRYGYPYCWWQDMLMQREMAVVAPRLTWHILPSVDSTNHWMREHLKSSATGLIHLAVSDFQRAGQGRRGRQWLSLPGRQMTVTMGLVSSSSPVAWVGVAIAVGVCIAQTLNAQGWPVSLKWPNDLWLGGAKLGGILIEMDAMAEGPSHLIIGFGINEHVLSGERESLAREVAALSDAKQPYDRHVLLGQLAASLSTMLESFAETGLAPWQAAWRRFDVLHGCEVNFERYGQWQSGIAQGIDAQGALQIRQGDELVSCHSGEVTVRAI